MRQMQVTSGGLRKRNLELWKRHQEDCRGWEGRRQNGDKRRKR